MKDVFLSVAAAITAFIGVGYPLGIFQAPSTSGNDVLNQVDPSNDSAKSSPPTVFPEDLLPAANGQPVPAAASFGPSEKPHKFVFLYPNGSMHPWNKELSTRDNKLAYAVEETELVVLLAPGKKTLESTTDFGPGSDPLHRYKYETAITIVEAKTGKTLCEQTFVNLPRAVRKTEAWDLKELGKPVSANKIIDWVIEQSNQAFPQSQPQPIVNVIYD